MATLADELLNDFEDSGSEGEGEKENGFLHEDDTKETNGIKNEAHGAEVEVDMDEGDDSEDEEMADEEALHGLKAADTEEEAKSKVEKMQLGGVGDVRSVASLMKTLDPILEVRHPLTCLCPCVSRFTSMDEPSLMFRVAQKIAYYQSLPPEQQTTHVGSIEDNPEYHLLTQANTLSTSIDTEIILVHKFIRDHYSVRFPELETLITGPVEYAMAVAIIGNGPMDNVKALAQKTDNLTGNTLRSILGGPTTMVVTVEATTTRGRSMSDAELATVQRACAMTLSLERAKRTLADYVQSRMNVFAPNLTAVVGSLTAARLLNATGGLAGLARTPDRNLPALGSKRATTGTGRATNVDVRQQGFVYQSPLVQQVPDEFKRQAMRIVSAKVVLAARVDLVHGAPSGAQGEQLHQDCLDRLDRLTAPPADRGPRAIPPPDDKPSRKRGGRRARKAKEATAPTELRRAQNRMAFGQEEAEVGYGTGEGTAGFGMLGQKANAGRIRALQVDGRTRAKLSKGHKGWGAATPGGGGGGTASSLRGFGQGSSMAGNASVLRAHGLRSSGVGENAASGTSSSIAFTPVQGLELADPSAQRELKRKRDAEDDRWFKSGTFTQVGAGSVVPGAGKAGAFKVPPLPAKAALASGGSMGPPPPKRVA